MPVKKKSFLKQNNLKKKKKLKLKRKPK